MMKLNSIGTIKVFARSKEDGIVNIVITNFVKIEISCFMEDIVQVPDENISLLIAITIHQIVSNDIL